ncbi:hypothetical protein P3T76_007623 [Phytophthora citrophthora]|uniref:Avr1b-1 avirulence-like protein n=1 Tax=Phytophthora citrophthora TaxID=4793 RepID=A0AAD9GM04_9STRA|nr:hypothetical protein P3T76_007623 [Phytophthora citrophthora]
MRLYNVLLAAAVALFASDNGFAAADKCTIVTKAPGATTDAPIGSSSYADSGSSTDTPVTQDSTAASDVGASEASTSNGDDTEQESATSSSDSYTPSSVDASQNTDVASSTAADSDTSLTFTEVPKTTTTAPTVAASSSASGSSSNNSTTAATTKPSTSSADNSKLCAKPRIEITKVDVGVSVDANEDEVALKPVAIAAIPSGGSRIAFQSGDSIIVQELDASDKLVSGSTVKVPLHDFADIYADEKGFVILGTRDAEGGGTLNCGNPSNMCGSPPSPAVPCYDMYLVRYDGTKESWATKLTSSSASLPPYSTGKTGPDVYMIWWYAHHGRIAFDGKNWAAYFGAAISTSEGGCINIHQGDRMKVVDASGKITANEDSFDWGCSHSGYERVTYDNRTDNFAAICKTDSNNRIMPPKDWGTTIYPVDLAASNLGDIVPSGAASKYWATVSNGNGDNAKVHLIHFALNAKASDDITLGGTDANERAPHLASIGSGGLLAMWEGSSSGGDLAEGGDRTIYAQVLDASSGKSISEKVTVDKSVVGNRYQALKSYPDGSVAYLSKGASDTSLQVVRFYGC